MSIGLSLPGTNSLKRGSPHGSAREHGLSRLGDARGVSYFKKTSSSKYSSRSLDIWAQATAHERRLVFRLKSDTKATFHHQTIINVK